ncbi:hypothetical protein MNBD_DELTA01-376 [hydrothermal vent metagenome]|uniref:DUF2802 domain-containing protein n=1 Tax=hydrothermal vent metagenome TaxID=652676 RepID=A0A3B0R1J4_9ZZZZ
MNKWNIILLVSDIVLMGVVLFLLFRMRSSVTAASGEPRSGEKADALEAELSKVKQAARSLEIKRAEMDSLGEELKEKQDHLESVIGKVEAVIDSMAAPVGGAGASVVGAGASVVGAESSVAGAEPSRGETLAMAREMISEGKSLGEISAKLNLYRGELELLKSLDEISSE